MDKITAEMLTERGYKEFSPSCSVVEGVSRFFQKKITFSEDEDLFINLYIYDLSIYNKYEGPRFVFSAQINTDYCGTTFNIETVGWKNDEATLSQVEDLFIEVYEVGKRMRKLKGEN